MPDKWEYPWYAAMARFDFAVTTVPSWRGPVRASLGAAATRRQPAAPVPNSPGHGIRDPCRKATTTRRTHTSAKSDEDKARVPLTGMLAEFRTALAQEIEAAKRNLANSAVSLVTLVFLYITSGWIYFTAPVLGMLLAAQIYRGFSGSSPLACPKLHHCTKQRCIFCGQPGARPSGRLSAEGPESLDTTPAR